MLSKIIIPLAIAFLLIGCKSKSTSSTNVYISKDSPTINSLDTSKVEYKHKDKYIGVWHQVSKVENPYYPLIDTPKINDDRYLSFTADSFYYMDSRDTLFKNGYIIVNIDNSTSSVRFQLIENDISYTTKRDFNKHPDFTISRFKNDTLYIGSGLTHGVEYSFKKIR